MDQIEITIKDKSVNAITLSKWVKSITLTPITTMMSLSIARDLLNDKTWKPVQFCIESMTELKRNTYCDIVISESDHDKKVREHDEFQEKCNELLRLGADGNSESAIEYCKLELAMKVNHSAYA